VLLAITRLVDIKSTLRLRSCCHALLEAASDEGIWKYLVAQRFVALSLHPRISTPSDPRGCFNFLLRVARAV
jgi:hypothetical protein